MASTEGLLVNKLQALVEQLDKLNRYYADQDKREQKSAAIWRDEQDRTMQAVRGPRLPEQIRTQAERARLTPQGLYVPSEISEQDQVDPRLPSDSQERLRGFKKFKKTIRQEKQKALQTFESQAPRGKKGSMAPNAQGQPDEEEGGLGHPITNESALSWAVLGEHGGPQPIRNLALQQYGLQKSLDWAHGTAHQLGGYLAATEGERGLGGLLNKIPGVSSDTMASVMGVTQAASKNSLAAFAAYKGFKALGQMGAGLQGNQVLGQSLGYGPPPGGQTFFGFHNPLGDFSTAAQVGAAYNIEAQALAGRVPGYGFGGGISTQAAQADVQTMAEQGWRMNPAGGGGVGGALMTGLSSLPLVGHPLAGLLSGIIPGTGPSGPADDILQGFIKPLQEKFPGLANKQGGEDLAQFDQYLRYSGTSIRQLNDSLTNLGDQAQAANIPLGQFTSSVYAVSQSFEQMGGMPQGGVDIGTAQANMFGLPPQVASQFAQSPMFQGLALSKYGVLPSGLASMNPGAFGSTELSELQMLQSATAGLNQNKYANFDGQRVLVQSGRQAQLEQVAQMSGLPYNVVKQMLGNSGQWRQQANVQGLLGGAEGSTGIWSFLNRGNTGEAQKYWNQKIAPNLGSLGLSKDEIAQLNQPAGPGISGNLALKSKANMLADDLAKKSGDSPWNKLQKDPSQQTVTVKFTGLAAKFFQQAGISQAKASANAGGPSFSSVLNRAEGDVTNPAQGVGDLLSISNDMMPWSW